MSTPSTPPPLRPTQPPPTPEQRRRSRPKTWLIVVAITVPLSLMVIFGGYISYYENKKHPVKPEDRAVIVDADAVVALMDGYIVRDELGSIAKRRALLGHKIVEYEYDDDSDTAPLYIQSTVTVERSVDDAVSEYVGHKLAMMVIANGLDTTERNDLLSWGDESRCLLYQIDGQTLGIFFIARNGPRTAFFTITGLGIGSPKSLRDLLEQRLDRLATYNPSITPQ